jgi:hypothetical protein
VSAAGFTAGPDQIIVEGEIEDKEGGSSHFEVTVSALSGEIDGWKLKP